MSRVPSRPARVAVRSAAPSPAVAGFRPAAVAVAAALALGAHAQSVPIGAVHGTATYERNGNNLLVTTTNGAGNRSVINWQTFGVPGGSTTYFQQPDAASTSINRVLGGVRSDIFGSLGSNGRLVLVNPSGIAIGAGAMVDTAGFTASTLNLSQDDAIAGRMVFQGGTEGITVGEGARILAHDGDVVLVGSQVQVERNAVVRADGATILAAGEKVEITGRGLEGIRMEVQAGNEAVNLGTLQGDAVGIFAQTLRHSGLVQAQAVSAGGGKVVLQALGGDNLVDGSVVASAQGGKGGSIDLLGNRVGLLAGANMDASGTNGGGSIRIGGDYQGGNPDVPNAQAVYVDGAASIKADATLQGDGGRVIVWSDGLTQMHGRISARGGAQGGDGGFAEVSGKKVLEFTGRADLRALQGRTGTLLLDPNDIIIDASAATDTPSSTPAPAVWQYSGGTGTSHINESDLEGQLASSNVVVLTNGGSGGNGDITVASGVDIGWSGDYTLALQADRNIVLQGSVTATGPNSVLSMQALGGTITQTSGAVTVANLLANAKGDVTMAGANMVDRVSGNTTLYGANGNFTFNNGKDVTLGTVSTAWGGSFNGVNAGTGDVLITTTAGNIVVAPPPPASTLPPAPSGVVGRNVTLQAKNAVDLQGNVTASALAKIKAAVGGISQSSGAALQGGSIDVHAGSDIALWGSVASRGGITVTSDNGGITFNTLSAAGEQDAGPEINGGNVTLQAKGDISGYSIDAYGGYGYTASDEVGGNGGVVKATSTSGGIDIGYINVSAGGSTSAVTAGNAGGVTLTAKTAGTGNIYINDIQANGGSGESGTKGGTVVVEAGGSITLASIYAHGGDSTRDVGGDGGDIHLLAGGGITFFYGEGGLLAASDYYGGVQAIGGGGGTNTGTGDGLRGGKGGLIEIKATSGDLLTDGMWLVAADGGVGGNGFYGTAGGQGGDGGEIKLIASAGRVELATPWIYAKGGAGGENPDASLAPSGVNGIFRAMGTSVDVVSDFELNADWVNDSIVKVTGASQVYGSGFFQNNSDVQLFDTARLNAYNGFANAGRFSAFGSDNQANLTLNTSTGLVEVVAGSTLSTPAFLLNQGTVKIDGTLRTADPPAPALDLVAASVPTSGPLFTNEATGTLTGNGTLVVGGGAGTVQNFGTVAPGGAGSLGMLTLDASLLMESGSTYAADLLNSGSHDTLVVTGSVASGGNFAVNYLSGASFSAGDSFTMLKSGGLDATTVPGVDKPELKAQASGNDVLLVATAAFPPPPPPPPAPAVQEEAVQAANNQVVTFADLFVKMSEDQDKKRIGKDDIVITDTACTR